MSNQRRRAEERQLLKAAKLLAEPSEPKPKLNSQQKRTKNNPVLLTKALEFRQRHRVQKQLRNVSKTPIEPLSEEVLNKVKELTLGVSFTDADFE